MGVYGGGRKKGLEGATRNRHVIFSTCRPNSSGVWAAVERAAGLIDFKARSEGNVQRRQFCVLEGIV